MDININPMFTKFILYLTQFTNKVIVVCKGYNEDYDNYTELVWDDDKDININDYEDYRLWIL